MPVSSQDFFEARSVNLAALDPRSPNRPLSGSIPAPASRRPWSARRESAPLTPACRLRLEGRDANGDCCDILELSAEGVTIALREGRFARPGQQGQLLIGPAEGAHYTLPVAVRRVKDSPSAIILELAFPTSERWTYSRG
ncbi:MAG: hypothetical protein VKO39_08625 [Cyanobacteriota bacterium]|nr:hypothetical protein [Cyanobacteriota bacterium]